MHEDVAHTLKAEGHDASEDGTGRGVPLVAVCFSAKDSGADASTDIAPTMRAMGHSASHANGGGQLAVAFAATDYKDGQFAEVEQAGPLTTSADRTRSAPVVAFNMHKSGNEGSSLGVSSDRTDCLRAFDKSPFAVMPPASAVRRLTPRECERLQGFPDDYTLVPVGKKKKSPAKDGPRYKALGNSMAVPVMRWIGERIAQVEAVSRK